MLQPKKTKWRKQHKMVIRGRANCGYNLTFGDYGLQSLETGYITARQIEAGRIAISRCIQRGGKVWIRIFPDKPVSKKPAETRMGSGKGNPEFWVAPIQAGKILYEMEGVTPTEARAALDLARHKLPLKCKFISRGTHREV